MNDEMRKRQSQTAVDDLLLLAFQARSLVSWVREQHDPVCQPEEYARTLFGCLGQSRPARNLQESSGKGSR